MKINFDNYRKSFVNDYNRLIDLLNDNPENIRRSIDIEKLDTILTSLHNDLATLCSLYGDDQKSIADEITIKELIP